MPRIFISFFSPLRHRLPWLSLAFMLCVADFDPLEARSCAYYVAPLCIGIGFTGALSWSIFRRPNRIEPTLASIHPVTLTSQPHGKAGGMESSISQAVKAFKDHSVDLHHTVTLQHNREVLVTRGVPTTGTGNYIWLVSPGYKGQRPQKYQQEGLHLDSCVHETYGILNTTEIPATCATFDYDDSRRCFNFAQTGDLKRLTLLYNELAPSHNLVLFGSCRGATTLLNLLSRPDIQFKDNVHALILESPSTSLKNLAHQVAKNYVGWLPGSPSLVHLFFKFWFPQYDAHYASFLDNLSAIPRDLPILIGHIEHDKVIAWEDIQALVKGLIATGHTELYLARINDPSISHARLSSTTQFQNTLNAFLERYTIPHNYRKALAGRELLTKARQEAIKVATESN
jgi:hypothetical protein